MPRVTILMPVHNGARYIGDAVRSALHQTFADFELLVIDDGSTDESADIVSSFRDARIRLSRNEQKLGLTPTLNRGLALASGELIARQDADDLSEPTRLARQVGFLDAHAGTAVVGAWYRKVDDDGRLVGDRKLPVDDARLRWALLSYCPIVHSAATFRKAAVTALGGYDQRFLYAQDFDLWSRLARVHRLATVPEFLVRYRVHGTSMTTTFGESSGEGPTISLANAERLSRAVGAAPISAPAHVAMSTLLQGDAATLGSEELATAFQETLRLLEAFCAQPIVSPADAGALRAEVLGVLRRRLIQSMDRLSGTDFEQLSKRLYGRTRWSHFLKGGRVRAAVAAVGRSRLGAVLIGIQR